jgi:hypothetical protein
VIETVNLKARNRASPREKKNTQLTKQVALSGNNFDLYSGGAVPKLSWDTYHSGLSFREVPVIPEEHQDNGKVVPVLVHYAMKAYGGVDV